MIVIDELGPFHIELHQTSTLRGSIIQHKHGIQLCYGVCLIPSNTLQFQYFWDFNKCLEAIFSQLTFGYIFWMRLL